MSHKFDEHNAALIVAGQQILLAIGATSSDFELACKQFVFQVIALAGWISVHSQHPVPQGYADVGVVHDCHATNVLEMGHLFPNVSRLPTIFCYFLPAYIFNRGCFANFCNSRLLLKRLYLPIKKLTSCNRFGIEGFIIN